MAFNDPWDGTADVNATGMLLSPYIDAAGNPQTGIPGPTPNAAVVQASAVSPPQAKSKKAKAAD